MFRSAVMWCALMNICLKRSTNMHSFQLFTCFFYVWLLGTHNQFSAQPHFVSCCSRVAPVVTVIFTTASEGITSHTINALSLLLIGSDERSWLWAHSAHMSPRSTPSALRGRRSQTMEVASPCHSAWCVCALAAAGSSPLTTAWPI